MLSLITGENTIVTSTKSIFKRSLLLGVGVSTLAVSSEAVAQDNLDDESYKINDSFQFSVEGTNLLNTARKQFNPTRDNFAEINVFGPRYFAGITAKF